MAKDTAAWSKVDRVMRWSPIIPIPFFTLGTDAANETFALPALAPVADMITQAMKIITVGNRVFIPPSN